jgi:flagellar biosynthetic protein FliR
VNFTLSQDWLITLLLCSSRCLAWMSIAPPIATSGIPKTIKVAFGVALGLATVPSAQGHVPQPEFLPVVSALLVQIFVGVAVGFITRLLFAAIEGAGSLIDLFGGFSAVQLYDPFSKAATSIFGTFYAMLCSTLIFATDTHLVIFGGFLRTFSAVPLDAGLSLSNLDHGLVQAVTQLFIAALQIAGPLIIVIFIADVALGVLNRISPQLNAFQLSFPIKIGLTLMLVGVGFVLMPRTIIETASNVNDLIARVTG